MPPTATAAVSRSFPSDHKGDREKRRVTLEPEPEEAKVAAEIFDLFINGKHSPKAIANHLNRPGGPPSPRHVDASRNLRGHWAASTIRAMLQNPVYTGRTVWNRLDFTEAKHAGGGARRRAKEEWVVAEETYLPLVTDETFEVAQGRFSTKGRGTEAPTPRTATSSQGWFAAAAARTAGDGREATQGSHLIRLRVRGHYGDTAALEAHGDQKFVSAREDRLLRLVLRFFEQRIFGPLRLERLEKQLRSETAAAQGRQARRHAASPADRRARPKDQGTGAGAREGH